MRRVWSFVRPDGSFTGESFEGDPAVMALNVPEGCTPVEGRHDHLCRRVDVETGEIVDWQPPRPAGDEHTGYRWDDGIRRWVAVDTLAGRKRKLADQFNVAKTAQIDAGVTFEGRQYQSDAASRLALLERVMALPAGGPTVAAGTWTDADNVDVPMTRSQLRALLAAMSGQRDAIHNAIRVKKAAIESAADDAALDALAEP